MTRLLAAYRRRQAARSRLAYLRRVHTATTEPARVAALAAALRRTA